MKNGEKKLFFEIDMIHLEAHREDTDQLVPLIDLTHSHSSRSMIHGNFSKDLHSHLFKVIRAFHSVRQYFDWQENHLYYATPRLGEVWKNGRIIVSQIS